jgi:hypothetical protein
MANRINLAVLSAGTGTCALTGKADTDGLTVAFENEAPCFVSWKAFRQLLAFKAGQTGKPETRSATVTAAVPTGNSSK